MANQYHPDGQGERNWRIWIEYVEGANQHELAAQHNLTQARISQIIKAVRDTLPQTTRQEWRDREVVFLNEMRQEVIRLLRMPLAPVTTSQGKIVRDEDGKIVRDASARLHAFDRVLKSHEKLVHLLGLADTASKELPNSNPSEAAERAASDAARYLHGDPYEGV